MKKKKKRKIIELKKMNKKIQKGQEMKIFLMLLINSFVNAKKLVLIKEHFIFINKIKSSIIN